MKKIIQKILKPNSPIKASNNKDASIIEIAIPSDEQTISEWAKHFRNQYCDDNELEELIQGTKKSKKVFLKDMIFPSGLPPGPSIRAGDFAEALLSDYLEFIETYWVPRNRLQHKASRNESVKGSDVIAIKMINPKSSDPNDVLAVFESKARLSKKSKKTLQDAIDHSGKDYLRIAHTLNATKRRYLQTGQNRSAKAIQRFQNFEDNPFTEIYGAVSFCTSDSIDDSRFFNVDDTKHPKKENLSLLVFHGKDLMNFVHKLYKVAIDEAGK